MLDALFRQLGDVDEAGRLDADVDERAEIRDVAHGAAQDRAGLDVGELHDGLARQRRGQVFTRVAARGDEGVEDVMDGRQACAELLGERGFLVLRQQLALRGEQGEVVLALEVFERKAEAVEELFGKHVRFGMHRRVIERRAAAVDAQEARALRERGRTEARNL